LLRIEKSNILPIGPSGSGITHLVGLLASYLDIPLVIGDATSLTETGYVGDDVESLLSAAPGEASRLPVIADRRDADAHPRWVEGVDVEAGIVESPDYGGDHRLVEGCDESAVAMLPGDGLERNALTVHPQKPLLIVPVRKPATMPSNLFHAPIQDVIERQNGSHAGILGSDPATPGDLQKMFTFALLISRIGVRKR
jgi:hypothetical protein